MSNTTHSDFSDFRGGAPAERHDAPAERCAQRPTFWRRRLATLRLCFKRFWFIVGRWLEEPIGVAVPLIATVLILCAPQMPDMFAGLADASRPWWLVFAQSALFGLSAFLLGFFSWYWTRAALSARIKRSDLERENDHPDKDADVHQRVGRSMKAGVSTDDPAVSWSRTRAPRLGICCSALIAAAPFLIIAGRFLAAVFSSDQNIADVGWMGFDILFKAAATVLGQKQTITGDDWKGLLGLPLGFALYLLLIIPFGWFTSERHRLKCHAKRRPPEWMWRFTTTSTFAAAPFGWQMALALLALSVLGYASVAALPDVLHWIGAPNAALFALALLIGPMVIGFAVFRDGVAEVLERAAERYRGWFGVLWRVLVSALGVYWICSPPFWIPSWIPIWVKAVVLASPCAYWLIRPLFLHFAPLDARDRYRRTPIVEKASWALGLIAFLAVIYGPSFTGYASEHYAIRSTGIPVDANGRKGSEACVGLCRPTLNEALQTWFVERRKRGEIAGTTVPVVIVATEGGASRAAAWTLAAMKRLDLETDGAFGRHLFAISSVSGGSLGALTYVLAAAGQDGQVNWKDDRVKKALDELASADLLSAAFATFFLNDTLTQLVLPPLCWLGHWLDFRIPDRARALEAAFEQHWSRFWLREGEDSADARKGLVELYAHTPQLPHLLLNGTDVATGQRVITSTIRFSDKEDLFPGSDDYIAVVGTDLPVATAVTNTARFPYISPSGQFWRQDDPQHKHDPRQLVDGGYFENYGARTAADLARKIGAINPLHLGTGEAITFVPIVVVISNDLEGYRSQAELERCKGNSLGRTDCFLLEEVTVTCDWRGENAGDDGNVASEFSAPVLGLYATRHAHGRDAQHILRHAHCPGPEAGALYPGYAAGISRVIHMAVPRVDPGQGEAAPLNWVLNGNVRRLLVDHAPCIEFNNEQAKLLKTSLEAVAGGGDRGVGTVGSAASELPAASTCPPAPDTEAVSAERHAADGTP